MKKRINKVIFLSLTLLVILSLFTIGFAFPFQDFEFGVKDGEIVGTLDESGVLTIGIATTASGIGAMGDFGMSDTPVHSFENEIKSVVILPGVTSIGDNAFQGCANLISITIPDSVTSIGIRAFQGNTSLESITLPDTLTTIKEFAFTSSGLTSITIPDLVKKIEDYTFSECESLASVNGSGKFDSIGSFAFDTTALTSFTIQDTVASIGEFAFGDVVNLATINNLYNGNQILGNYVFDNAGINVIEKTASAFDKNVNFINAVKDTYTMDITSTSDTFDLGASVTGLLTYDGLLTISGTGDMYDYDNTYDSALFSPLRNNLYVKKIVIESGVTNIGDYVFQGCTNLDSITIPTGVTSIGSYAFQDNSSLKSITLPDTLTTIEDYAFMGSGLTSITIPNLVKTIGNFVFSECSDLTNVFGSGLFESIGDYAFESSGLTTFTIHDTVTNIGECAFSNTPDLAEIFNLSTVSQVIGENAFRDAGNAVAGKTAYAYKNNVDFIQSVTNTYDETNVPYDIVYNDIFTVTFEDGKEGENYTESIYYNTLVTKPSIVFEGKTLVGWYLEPEFITEWDFNNDKTPFINFTLYAKWESDEPIIKTLINIVITNPPTLKTYVEGSNFDKTGMTITATYNDATTALIADYTVDKTTLNLGVTSVLISYTEEGITKTTIQGVTVTEKPSDIVNGGGGGGGGTTPSPEILPVPDIPPITDNTLFILIEDLTRKVVLKNTISINVATLSNGYLNGYEDNTFRPENYITRAEVTQIFSNILGEYVSSGQKFTDVTDEWYSKAIDKVVSLGIMKGYEDGTFKPEKYLTRQELAIVLLNLIDQDNSFGNTATELNDLEGKYGKKSIELLISFGLINGYEDNTFRPEKEITRAETITLINNLFTNFLGDGTNAAEITDIQNSWAKENILKAFKRK